MLSCMFFNSINPGIRICYFTREGWHMQDMDLYFMIQMICRNDGQVLSKKEHTLPYDIMQTSRLVCMKVEGENQKKYECFLLETGCPSTSPLVSSMFATDHRWSNTYSFIFCPSVRNCDQWSQSLHCNLTFKCHSAIEPDDASSTV